MQVAHGVAAAQSQPAVSKADASKVWALAASTQDDDLLDDDELLTDQDQRLPEVPGVPGTPHLLVCLATVGWCSCLIVRMLSNKGDSVAG